MRRDCIVVWGAFRERNIFSPAMEVHPRWELILALDFCGHTESILRKGKE